MAPPLLDVLALPVIAAPMTGVSGPDLVIASCAAGVIAGFPAHNAATTAELSQWLAAISSGLAAHDSAAPVAVNLVVHSSNDRLDADLDCLAAHRPPMVITSVGSPAAVMGRLHDWGCVVFADVASMRHVDRALAAGADGLVLLCAGAGGQTGSANPLAFVRAVRQRFDGPLVLAGGICDGQSLWAARLLGADLGYVGTRFIATQESLASASFKTALIEAGLDDVVTSAAPSGLPANFLREWLIARDARTSLASAGGFRQSLLFEHTDAWSAGHSVVGVARELCVAELVAELATEYRAARDATAAALVAAGPTGE
jgi:nitronate monooxygenase